MLKYFAKISVFVCLLSAFNLAIAGYVEGLYDVDVLVTDESAVTREKAFIQGLDEVFVRISGDSIVMDKLKRPAASRYIKQYSYDPVEKPVPDENGVLQIHRLKIQYNGSMMEKYLLDNGFPAWGANRPDVIVWLVVRDGRNEYVLKDVDQSLLKTAAVDALQRRGIPNQWPVYDKKDKRILSVSDIRGGFKEPVADASQRYTRGPALTGSMIWNGKQWQSSWSLLMEGESRYWNLDDVDHKKLINNSIDQAADALGVIFAVHTTDDKQKLASVLLDVQAVNSIENYRYVENYLTGLSAVDRVKPHMVDGQKAVYEVLLRSNEEDFLNLIKNDAELAEVAQSVIDTPKIKVPDASAQKLPASDNKALKQSTEKQSGVTSNGGAGNSVSDQDVKGQTNAAAKNEQAVAEESVDSSSPEQKKVYYYRLNRSS